MKQTQSQQGTPKHTARVSYRLRKSYHHRLYQPHPLPIRASIPTTRLQRHIIHPQSIHLPTPRLLRHLDREMPQSIISLTQDLPRRFEVAGRDGAEPEEGHVAARGVRVGQREPFAHRCGGRGPGEACAEGQGVDDGDGFVGVWVLGEEGREGFAEVGRSWAASYGQEEVGCTCLPVRD